MKSMHAGKLGVSQDKLVQNVNAFSLDPERPKLLGAKWAPTAKHAFSCLTWLLTLGMWLTL